MSRLGGFGPPAAVVPQYDDSDSDESDEGEGGGFRIAAAPDNDGGGSSGPKLSDNFIASSQYMGDKDGFTYKDGPLGKGYYKSLGPPPAKPKPTPQHQQSHKPMSARDILAMVNAKEKKESKSAVSVSVVPNSVPDDDDEDDEDDGPGKKGFGSGLRSKAKQLMNRKPQAKSSVAAAVPVESNHPATPRGGSGVSPVIAAPPPSFSAPSKPAPHAVPAKPAPVSAPVKSQAPPAISTPPAAAPKQASGGAERRLAVVCEDVGFDLPATLADLGYPNSVLEGSVVHVSAHGPQLPKQGFVRGVVGGNGLNLEHANVAATLTAFSLLAAIKSAAGGSLERVRRVVSVNAQVACSPGADVDLREVVAPLFMVFKEVFGNEGQGAVSLSGVSSLPGNVPLQASMVVMLK